MAKRGRTRDPLKQEPLPQPGESTREMLLDSIMGEPIAWIMAAAIAICVTSYSWLAWWHQAPIEPVIMTVPSLIIVLLAAIRIPRAVKKAQRLALGARGEASVGELLAELREKGYRVFHDIQEDGYNIDHVLIGPTGVYTIETKTRSKPATGEAVVTFDGDQIRVAGHTPDRDPIKQVTACADRIAELFAAGKAPRPKIRSVVLFPGWWVQQRVKSPQIWVLNPKQLWSYMKHEPEVLRPEDIARLTGILETHVRAGRAADRRSN